MNVKGVVSSVKSFAGNELRALAIGWATSKAPSGGARGPEIGAFAWHLRAFGSKVVLGCPTFADQTLSLALSFLERLLPKWTPAAVGEDAIK
jgi:hypothetical protein